MPGQTQLDRRSSSPGSASMEGRAIARPNSAREPTSARYPSQASMEGRAIARPNLLGQPARRAGDVNGGPGNCPAKPPMGHGPHGIADGFNGGPGNCPAKLARQAGVMTPPSSLMEGRAIARPLNLPRMTLSSRCFNGGPGNCPAKPAAAAFNDQSEHFASMEGRAIARPNCVDRSRSNTVG